MNTYIALLRGINVGGRNKLPMGELVEVLTTLGLQNVQTYIQSGNVVFESGMIDPAALSERISLAINVSHGFTPQVFLLKVDELADAIASTPFPEAEYDTRPLHLFFLATTPESPALQALESVRRVTERFELKGNVFYLHAPDGIGRSKLAERVEKTLGVAVTARNWRSVCRILDLGEGMP